VLKGHTRIVNGGDFSSDSRYPATASADGTARLWAVKESLDMEKPPVSAGEFQGKEKKPPTSALKAAAFSPDGSFVVIAGEESLKLFATAIREELATLKLDFPTDGIAMSLDGRRIATMQMSIANLWEAAGSNFVRWRIRQPLERIDRNDVGPGER
jgi:WD40 repeat protein